jgi:hypothetical protein
MHAFDIRFSQEQHEDSKARRANLLVILSGDVQAVNTYDLPTFTD